MKVFTAHREYDYEGFQIIGVFTTKEAAEKCCIEDVDESGRKYGDSHDVEEHVLYDT
jgi:hypothetical protein